MPRIRTVKPGFFKDPDLAKLSPIHRLVFGGLFCQADREGRLEDDPELLKTEICPFDDFDMDGTLEDLHIGIIINNRSLTVNKRFIHRYAVEAKFYIQIINFGDHQRPHNTEKPSEIPPPENLNGSRTVIEPLNNGPLTNKKVRKGREGKGKELKNDDPPDRASLKIDDPENREALEDLEDLCKKIAIACPGFNPLAFINKKAKDKGTTYPLEVFFRVFKDLLNAVDIGGQVKNPWAFCETVFVKHKQNVQEEIFQKGAGRDRMSLQSAGDILKLAAAGQE